MSSCFENMKEPKNHDNNAFSTAAPVPDTDLNCAIDAISKQESDGVQTNQNQQNNDEFDSSINVTRKTISNKLKKLTKPISVDNYNELICYYTRKEITNKEGGDHILDDERNDSNINMQDDSDSDSMLSEGELSSDCEDEERLLDEEAFIRAKSLRVEIRNSIQSVMAYRSEVPKLAVNLTLENIRRHDQEVNSIPMDESIKSDGKNDSNFDEIEFERKWREKDGQDLKDMISSSSDVSNMHHSLVELSKTLQSLEKALPEKFSGLQETSDIIECSLNKYLAVQKGDSSLLSAVERAIFSKANDGRIERNNECNEENVEDDKEICIENITNSPGTRLTRFMF